MLLLAKKDSIKYLDVNLIVRGKLLTLDVDVRIRKFNAAAFDVLLNTTDLSEILRCELITKRNVCLP